MKQVVMLCFTLVNLCVCGWVIWTHPAWGLGLMAVMSAGATIASLKNKKAGSSDTRSKWLSSMYLLGATLALIRLVLV